MDDNSTPTRRIQPSRKCKQGSSSRSSSMDNDNQNEAQPQPRGTKREREADDPSDGHPRTKKSPNWTEEMVKIIYIVEESSGQSIADLTGSLWEHEELFGVYIRGIYEALKLHDGHLGESLQKTYEEITKHLSNSSSEANPNGPPSPPTEKEAKEIVRSIGRLYSQLADVTYQLSVNRAVSYAETNAEIIQKRNNLAKDYATAIGEMGSYLQQSYIRSFEALFNSVKANRNRWETLLERFEIGMLEINLLPKNSTLVDKIQLLPRIIYPTLPNPQIRYKLAIPEDLIQKDRIISEDFSAENTLSSSMNCSRVLSIKYDGLELQNGFNFIKNVYSIQNIGFQVTELFSTAGWVTPVNACGKTIRTLQIDTTQFEEGTLLYRVELQQSGTEGAGDKSSNIAIILSGISAKQDGPEGHDGNEDKSRIEISLLLPAHLKMDQVNEAGIRRGILKFQFTK